MKSIVKYWKVLKNLEKSWRGLENVLKIKMFDSRSRTELIFSLVLFKVACLDHCHYVHTFIFNVSFNESQVFLSLRFSSVWSFKNKSDLCNIIMTWKSIFCCWKIGKIYGPNEPKGQQFTWSRFCIWSDSEISPSYIISADKNAIWSRLTKTNFILTRYPPFTSFQNFWLIFSIWFLTFLLSFNDYFDGFVCFFLSFFGTLQSFNGF